MKASVVLLFCFVVFFSISANAQSNCTYTLTSNLIVPASGGTFGVAISTQEGCTWTAEDQSSVYTNPIGLTFTTPTSGTGSGGIGFTVSQASTSERRGRIYVNGAILEIIQDRDCGNLFIDPLSATVPSEGTTQSSFQASSNVAGCFITVQSNAYWITVTGPDNNNTVNYSVDPNNGPARTGTISVVLKTSLFNQRHEVFTVNQQTNCTYSLDPASVNVGTSGGTVYFDVTTQSTCERIAAPTVPWITVIQNQTGTGFATVGLSIEANPGTSRTGTVTVGDQTFTVNQSERVTTAASVSVSGRVITSSRRGLANAVVYLTDSGGNTRTARTTSFGYYRFNDIAAGQTVTVTVVSKVYQFAPKVLNLNEEVTQLNFLADN